MWQYEALSGPRLQPCVKLGIKKIQAQLLDVLRCLLAGEDLGGGGIGADRKEIRGLS